MNNTQSYIRIHYLIENAHLICIILNCNTVSLTIIEHCVSRYNRQYDPICIIDIVCVLRGSGLPCNNKYNPYGTIVLRVEDEVRETGKNGVQKLSKYILHNLVLSYCIANYVV